jgi:hypothetical protein
LRREDESRAVPVEHAVVERIIRHSELTFAAENPPPSRAFEQVGLMAAAESGEHE